MLVNSMPFAKYSNNLSFKATGVGDLGSHGGANVKIRVNGEEKFPGGARLDSSNADSFKAALAMKWALALNGHKKEPNKLAQCLNGPVVNGEFYGTNVKDLNGESVVVPVIAIKEAIEAQGIKVANFVACNDGAFMGGAALKKLKEQGRDLNKIFPAGTETPFIFPGGGLGVGEIRGTKHSIEIIPREKGHLNLNINEADTIEKEMTSVPAIIKNFAKSEAVGLDNQKAIILAKSGLGSIVTSHTIKLDKQKDAEDIALLNKPAIAYNLDSKPINLFQVEDNGKTTTLVLKGGDGNPISKAQHDKAFTEASGKFYDGIGKVIHDYVAGGHTKKAVLTGKFVGYVMQHSSDLGQNPNRQIMDAVKKNSDHVCEKLIGEGIEIIHAPVKDGTSGGTVIANSKDENNGAWFSIDRNKINSI